MLRIEFDSDPAGLAQRFVAALAPGARPALVPDVLLVPTIGVGAWLQRLVAERYGIAALLEVSLGGRYIWQALERMIGGLPARSPFEPERARWVILDAFDEMHGIADGEPLASRIQGLDDRERFLLASRIARGFDRYLAFRRDWLDRWGGGRLIGGSDPAFIHESWQRWLWHRLLERLPNVSQRHPFERFRDALEQARGAGGDALERLAGRLAPGRIFVFGALSMSPEQFRLLAEFGKLRDIHWFAPDPSRDFWEHVVSPAQAARLVDEDPSQAWLFESEPAILGAWGKSQRDFLAQLRMLEGDAQVEVDESFRDRPVAPPQDALDALRKSILLLDDGGWEQLPAGEPDRSIEIHATHGEIRQVEVLHDRLLDAFESVPGLVPGDVVVYCSDVARFAPAIDAVFGSAPAGRRLPYRIADRDPRADPAVRAVIHLLAFARGPRDVGKLLVLLGNPLVRAACGIDEEDLQRIAAWLAEAGVHTDEKKEPEGLKHGWQAGLERLMLGMLANEDVAVVSGRRRVAGPLFADSNALERVLEILEDAAELAGEPLERPPAAWARRLLDWCEAMLAPAGSHAAGLARLREALARVVGSAEGVIHSTSLDVFGAALEADVASAGGAARAGGAITVCTLGALPGVPFRVSAMLGLDDEAWPRPSRRLEFDLMAAWPRFGDQLARSDDRGAFLDAVLASGDRLLCFYTGRDARDDSARNPSSQLHELVEYLRRVSGERIPVHQHGLQAFGAGAFDGRPPGRSFAAEWLGAARSIQEPPAARPGLAPVAGPGWRLATVSARAAEAGVEESIRLADLLGDLASPAQAYCRETLRIRRPKSATTIDEVAPFDPHAIDAVVRERVLAPIWRGDVAVESLQELVVDAPWAPAGIGETIMSRSLADDVAGAIEARSKLLAALGLADGAGESRSVSWSGAASPVVGRLGNLHEDRLQLVVSVFGANYRTLVDAWLRHALWLGSGEGRAGHSITVVLCHDRRKGWRGAKVSHDGSADEAICHALAWSRRIRSELLPLFPRAMSDLIAANGRGEDFNRDLALLQLGKSLAEGEPWSRGSSGAFAYEILWRAGLPDMGHILDAGLEAYGPIFGPIDKPSDIPSLCDSLGRP